MSWWEHLNYSVNFTGRRMTTGRNALSEPGEPAAHIKDMCCAGLPVGKRGLRAAAGAS